MQVLLAGFFFTPRAVQGYPLASEIGGCCVWDFAVFRAIDMDVVDGDFHLKIRIGNLYLSFQRNSIKSRNHWWVSISQLRCCVRLYL